MYYSHWDPYSGCTMFWGHVLVVKATVKKYIFTENVEIEFLMKYSTYKHTFFSNSYVLWGEVSIAVNFDMIEGQGHTSTWGSKVIFRKMIEMLIISFHWSIGWLVTDLYYSFLIPIYQIQHAVGTVCHGNSIKQIFMENVEIVFLMKHLKHKHTFFYYSCELL